jgi:purine-binding chemotaxis protein CheW
MKSSPPVTGGALFDEVKLACLRVGSAFYALDIMGIREIIRPIPIVQVPRAPAYIDGVITLRKAVIPVVDLRRRFGIEPRVESCERILICAVDGRIIGLVVDEVSEVATFARDEIQPAPYYMAGSDSEFFPAVCRLNEKLLLLIDLRKILSSDQRIDAGHIQQQALEGVAKD